MRLRLLRGEGGMMAGAGFSVPRLVVISAPDHDPLALTSPEMVLGRAETADLVLDDPFVSRRHALVTIAPTGEVKLQDLDSTGGTFVNDERVSGRRVLRSGDLVRFADVVTRFEAAQGAAQANLGTLGAPTQVMTTGPEHLGPEPAGLVRPDAERSQPETDYERVHTVKETAQARLLAIPGVHAVGVGPKMRSGQRTGVPSIIVFLTRKLPLAEIRAEHVVPAEIDGVRTDVMEMDMPRLLVAEGMPAPADGDLSRPRPMRGGVAVTPKDIISRGTLGCFATTQDNPPKVVAITCQHVVAPVTGEAKSDVTVTASGDKANPFKISFVVHGANTAGSLIHLFMTSDSMGKAFNAYWTVTGTDTAATIASGLAAAVNALSGSGVSAAAGPNPGDVLLTVAQGSDTAVHKCTVYDPPAAFDDVKLLASISGNVITLTGKAAGEYGVYTSWNTGSDPTRGAFTAVKEKTDLATIATAVAASVSAVITAQNITGVTATASGGAVTLQGATQVSCLITGDNRVGQPTDSFSSNCSLCCTDEMGRVLNADITTDSAIIQVRRGLKYLNEIQEDSAADPPFHNAVISGVRPLNDADVAAHTTVHKRGQKTGYTSGKVAAINVGGFTTEPDPNGQWTVYYRFVEHSVIILDDDKPFGSTGDSGAAVFDDSGKVVGLLYGYGKAQSGPGKGLVTHIGDITDALKINVATSTQLDQDQTVTDAQGAPAVVMQENDQLLPQLLTARAEITATPAGKRYGDLVNRHAGEVQALVNDNMRVTVVWHRNNGPEIVRALFRLIQFPDQRLPEQINGVPVAERLTRIRDALIRYGSAALAEDLNRYSAELLRLTGLTYREALAGLRTEDRA